MRRGFSSFLALALIAVQCAALCQCRLDHVVHQPACGHERLQSDVAFHADDTADQCGDHDVVKRPGPLSSPLPLTFDRPCIACAAITPADHPPVSLAQPGATSIARVLPLLS